MYAPKNRLRLFVCLLICFNLYSPKKLFAYKRSFSVMTYNLENLFDTIHDEGKEDYTFLPLMETTFWEHPAFEITCNHILPGCVASNFFFFCFLFEQKHSFSVCFFFFARGTLFFCCFSFLFLPHSWWLLCTI